uniref:Uncharacterized protein n=1 Tax=Rhizophora mucronata TaxID=61149 RepID=A0A2P2R483_RHIMU
MSYHLLLLPICINLSYLFLRLIQPR